MWVIHATQPASDLATTAVNIPYVTVKYFDNVPHFFKLMVTVFSELSFWH